MADPHLTPSLDGHDRLTIVLYRTSFFVGAAAALTLAWALWTRDDLMAAVAEFWISTAAALGAANLHLYVKRLRWLVPALAWLGFLALLGAPLLKPRPAEWAMAVGLGLHLVALGALVFKESFCFRIPGASTAPVLLGAGGVALAFELRLVAVALLGLGGALTLAVAIGKATQPLSHDIGDRSRYEI
jgi:uncharacterized integral membrane protein